MGSDEKRCELARLLSQALELADAADEAMIALHIAQALELTTLGRHGPGPVEDSK